MVVSLGKWEWYHSGETWVTGFIREGQEHLKGEKLHAYFSGIDSVSEFRRKLRDASGQFSIIIKKPSALWIATDRLRNYPLFYSEGADGYTVSDECYLFTEIEWKPAMNHTAERSMMSAGYVINSMTLLKGVFQAEAGEYVILGDEIIRKFYDTGMREVSGDSSDTERLEEKLHEAFRNHLTALKDRFIAIPLSGGFDSRLVAAMCAEYHPENVLCFTYGSKDQPEAGLARESAMRLGFQWISITYDEELVKGFIEDNSFQRYYPYASELTSMFYMQDYFAVKYLKENRIIPPDTVFIPGHSGDVLAGSHLEPAIRKISSYERIAELILRRFFDLQKPAGEGRKKLKELVSESLFRTESDPREAFEIWDRKERQAKFIVNSAKVFSFFGYDYILPLCDSDLINFFFSTAFRDEA